MGKALNGLSEVQKASFRAAITRLGLSADHLTHDDTLVTGPGPTHLSGDPKESKLTPTLIPVRSIAEIKKLGGIPDESYTSGKLSDRAIHYPAEFPQSRHHLVRSAANVCDLQDQLSPEEHAAINSAAAAYVQGNSQKVKSYEPILNALFFPAHVAAFVGDSITVTAGNPLIIGGSVPVVLNYAKVTVDPGGQIICNVQTTWNVQVFDSI